MLVRALLCSALCSALRVPPSLQRQAFLRMSDEVGKAQNPVIETKTIFDK